jgi:hypothetical protein
LNKLQDNIDLKQNIINDGSLSISKSLNLQSSLNTLQDNIDLKQNIITDESLSISKTLNLQTSLNKLQDTTDLNTANNLTKQSTINSLTDLETNSLTTTQFEVNGGVNIITKPHFDTIVFRRPNNTPQINLNEIQCWVGGVNILPLNSNDLMSYFAHSDLDKSYPSGDTGSRQGTAPVSLLYNNVIESNFVAHCNQFSSAVIITNIPLTAIENIQAFVLYNRHD